MHRHLLSLVMLGFVVALLCQPGCKPDEPADTSTDATDPATDGTDGDTDKAAPATDGEATDGEATDGEATDGEATDGKGADGTDGGTDDSSTTTAADPAKVQLGDPGLTSGIPGDGDLTSEQIQTWLDDDNNHVVLDAELPLGLAAGQGSIKGLDANPLTRAKIELGRQLFFDTRLSSDNTISCASCHQPGHGYAADTQFGVGVDGQEGGANSPVAYNRILSDKQFWDGRAASLEDQAIGPIANPIEMANTHEKAVETLKGIPGYKMQFDKIFSGEGVTIDNVGKAIATFERVLVTASSPFDHAVALKPYAEYTDDDFAELKEDDPAGFTKYEQLKAGAADNPMSESAVRGHELFFSDKSNCSACHVGANLTDEKFHNLGIGMDQDEPNWGRFGQTNEEKDKGAFKTPTIRNVTSSAPYMHDGTLATLEDVVEHYVKGGTPNEWLSKDIVKLDLTDQDKQDLVAFMHACSGELPPVETGRLP